MTADPEVVALLDATAQLVEALRRLTLLSEHLLSAAMSTEPLSPQQAASARHELDTTTTAVQMIDRMLTLRRQGLRPM